MDPRPALAAIEAEEGVAVLLAVESGSRAWGFPSPDSDWDVRFIYARPTLWHVQLQPGRDVIKRALPDDLDVSGWDMRKTLGLVLRGNCAVREWLCSPVIYLEEPRFVAGLRDIAARVPARPAALHHYASLARQVRERWLRRDPVPLKKYLYAVRPALALRWLRMNAEGSPPMDLPGLLAGVRLSAAEADALEALLRAKAVASEVGTGDALPALDVLIDGELAAAPVKSSKLAADPALLTAANALLMEAARFADARPSGPVHTEMG